MIFHSYIQMMSSTRLMNLYTVALWVLFAVRFSSILFLKYVVVLIKSSVNPSPWLLWFCVANLSHQQDSLLRASLLMTRSSLLWFKCFSSQICSSRYLSLYSKCTVVSQVKFHPTFDQYCLSSRVLLHPTFNQCCLPSRVSFCLIFFTIVVFQVEFHLTFDQCCHPNQSVFFYSSVFSCQMSVNLVIATPSAVLFSKLSSIWLLISVVSQVECCSVPLAINIVFRVEFWSVSLWLAWFSEFHVSLDQCIVFRVQCCSSSSCLNHNFVCVHLLQTLKKW